MDLIQTHMKSILKSARLKHFPRGQIILYEGDSVAEVFILKQGVVKLYDIDNQGNEKILHIVKSPAVLPFAFFSGENNTTHWFYTAMTDCDAYVIPHEILRKNMLDDAELSTHLNQWFSKEVHELLVRLSSLGKTNSRDKLEAALKFLAVCHGKQKRDGWHRVSFPVSHQMLADMVGITRESSAMVMKELQDEKLVRNPKQTVLEINFEKLIDRE